MSGTYVTDIAHYLDDEGEIVATMPAPTRKLASFLVLLIDIATEQQRPGVIESTIRCRKRGCKGLVHIVVQSPSDAIQWQCNSCEHNGLISHWQATKWDNRARTQSTGLNTLPE